MRALRPLHSAPTRPRPPALANVPPVKPSLSPLSPVLPAALETELFQGRIRLLGGANDGKEVMLDYEHFSKQDRRSGGGGQKSK